VPARRNLVEQRLELLGHPRPLDVGVRGVDALPEVHDQLRLGDQPLELRGHRDRVARLEQQTQLALAQRLLVLRQAGDDRDGAARQGAQHQLRRRRGPGRRGDRDRRAGQVLGLRAVGRAGQAHALAQPARQGYRRRRCRVAQPDRGPPVEVGRQPPQRAQEQPHRAPLLLGGEDDLGRALVRLGTLQQVRSRQDDAVLAREVALDQVARGGEAGGAPVEPPE
jgi:hypothetical protein